MRPRLRNSLVAVGAVLVAGLALTSCSNSGTDRAAPDVKKITISSNLGEVQVPLKPVRVAALDNTSFATVKALGVKPVAVPKELLPHRGYDDWKNDSSIKDVGDHREPKLEALNAAKPDLIIGGYRFTEFQEKLSKIATTIDIAPTDENYVNSLRKQTETLGKIFGKEEKAKEIVAALDKARDDAAEATHGESVFLGVTSAGKIDNGASRIGRLLEPLHLKNVLSAAGQDSTSVHHNSGLSPETIAQLNPDWMILMDRDGAVAEANQQTTPAKQLVDGQEAWAKSTFKRKGQVIYLPTDFYLTEGIQAYTAAFNQVATAFNAAR